MSCGSRGSSLIGAKRIVSGATAVAPVRLTSYSRNHGRDRVASRSITLTPLHGSRLRLETGSFGGFPNKDSPPGPQLPPAEAFFYTPERWYVDEGPLKGTALTSSAVTTEAAAGC